MSSPDLAELQHGANVLRALARNLQPADQSTAAPLDHPSAREAVTLLAWRGTPPATRSSSPSTCRSQPAFGWSTGWVTPGCSRESGAPVIGGSG